MKIWEFRMVDKKSMLLLGIQFLLVFILVFYLLARAKGAPVFLFWPIIWAIVISTIIGYKLPNKYKIISLVALEIALALIPVISLPEPFHMGRDSFFESQFASIITKEGRWDPSLGTGFAEDYYGHNPVLHFVLAFLSLTTGLTPYFLSKYIYIIILRVMFVLAAYLLILTIINKKDNILAYLATIVFMASPRLMVMGISRRLIAAIFMLLTIYVIFKSRDSPKKLWLILFFIFSTMVVLGDHSISSLFLIFMVGALIFSILTKSALFNRFHFLEKYKLTLLNIFPKFMFYLGVWILWNIIISKVLIYMDIGYIKGVMKLLFTGQIINLTSEISSNGVPSVHINYFYENLAIYASQFIFLLLGIIGFLFFVKYLSAEKESEFKIVDNSYQSLFLYFGLFSIIMYILSGFLMITSLAVISQTFLWFFSLPISIFFAYSLYLLKGRLSNVSSIVILLIMLILYSGGLLFSYTPTILNREPKEDVVLEFVNSKSQELYNSGLWLKNNAKIDSDILGDTSVFDIYSGFFEFDVITEGYAKDSYLLNDVEKINYFLQGSFLFSYYAHTTKNYSVDYVIINNAIFKYPSFMFGEPLDPSIKKNFDKANLDKIYDNKEIQIYHNNYNK